MMPEPVTSRTRTRKRRRNGLGLYQTAEGYQLDIIIAGRRRHRRYGRIPFEEAKARAKADAATFRAELLTGVSAEPKVVDLTVAAALTMRPLRAHLGPKRIGDLCALDLERYKRDWTAPTPGRRGSGQTKCNRELELLRTVVNACRTWGLTRADNPLADVKRFKEPKGRDRVLDYPEEDRLLAALPEPHRTLTQLALESGIRLQSEGVPLTWDAVDLDRARLHIKAADAKSGRERWVPLSAGMVTRLRAMREAAEQSARAAAARSGPVPAPPSPYVFAAKRGGPLTHFKHAYFKAVRTAGLAGTGVTIHGLRHTWASRFAEATGDLVLLQALGGWSSLTLVQRYAHARQERGADAIRRMVEARESHHMSHRADAVVSLNA